MRMLEALQIETGYRIILIPDVFRCVNTQKHGTVQQKVIY